jgi:hypothetical protein
MNSAGSDHSSFLKDRRAPPKDHRSSSKSHHTSAKDHHGSLNGHGREQQSASRESTAPVEGITDSILEQKKVSKHYLDKHHIEAVVNQLLQSLVLNRPGKSFNVYVKKIPPSQSSILCLYRRLLSNN